MPGEHALCSHRGSSVEGQQRASRERDPGMAEAAEQRGRPSVPVNGEYLRMENGDFTKRFNNNMRLNMLGNVAWMEFPTRKSRRRVTLRLTEDGGDAVTIDWRPANPEWQTGRLQLVDMEGARGLLEDQQKCWMLHREYSQEEVEKLLQDARGPFPV